MSWSRSYLTRLYSMVFTIDIVSQRKYKKNYWALNLVYVNFRIGLKLGKFTKESRRILEWLLCYIASIFSQISFSSTLSIKYSQRSGIVSRCHTFLWTAQVVFIPDQRWERCWDSVTTTGQKIYSECIWDEHPRYNKDPTPNWEYIILKNLYNISI